MGVAPSFACLEVYQGHAEPRKSDRLVALAAQNLVGVLGLVVSACQEVDQVYHGLCLFLVHLLADLRHGPSHSCLLSTPLQREEASNQMKVIEKKRSRSSPMNKGVK